MGFLPRMKRVQLVHQFLWYLVHGYGQQTVGSDDADVSFHVDIDMKDDVDEKVTTLGSCEYI